MDAEDVILDEDFEEGSEEDGDPEYEYMNDPPSTQASSGKPTFFFRPKFICFGAFLAGQVRMDRIKSYNLNLSSTSAGPASTPTSCTSSPPILGEDPASPNRGVFLSTSSQSVHLHQFPGNALAGGSVSGGKPPAIRRGPGRPRKEYPPNIRLTKDNRMIKR